MTTFPNSTSGTASVLVKPTLLVLLLDFIKQDMLLLFASFLSEMMRIIVTWKLLERWLIPSS